VVVGTVYDTLSGAPLRLVSVRVLETGRSVLTDDGGRYRVTGAPGELHLTARQIGYGRASLAVTAPPGLTRQDVYLRPAPVALPPVTVTTRRTRRGASSRPRSPASTSCSAGFTTTATPLP